MDALIDYLTVKSEVCEVTIQNKRMQSCTRSGPRRSTCFKRKKLVQENYVATAQNISYLMEVIDGLLEQGLCDILNGRNLQIYNNPHV
jgi:hypothetical protein